MFCKYCGSQMDGDSQFCPNCGAQVQAASAPPQQSWQQPPQQQAWQQAPQQPPRQQSWQQPPQQPVRGYRQSVGRDATYGSRGRSRRKGPVSAGFQGRLFGIPISGKAAIIILIVLVIVCIVLNKTGALN